MKLSELTQHWQDAAGGKLTHHSYSIHLPLEDAAKLEALSEMYPRLSTENLITDILTAALADLESTLPYVKGDTVIALDEEGDPIYEDVGPTPQFLELSRKYLTALKKQPC